jgi:hypothetical protein
VHWVTVTFRKIRVQSHLCALSDAEAVDPRMNDYDVGVIDGGAEDREFSAFGEIQMIILR